jgi:flagellar basal-body rod modification protein FlgD
MDLVQLLTPQERAGLATQIDTFNKGLARQTKSTLDRDDFLKILITQLTHQDPTQPMEDREFVAQMAQFSTLEQMVNMGSDIAQLSAVVSRSQAYSLLGKVVTVSEGDRTVSGRVDEVRGQEFPQVLVNGRLYDFADVESVSGE